jgi:hypothetical protein
MNADKLLFIKKENLSPDRDKDLVLSGILVHHGRIRVVKTEREGSNLGIKSSYNWTATRESAGNGTDTAFYEPG